MLRYNFRQVTAVFIRYKTTMVLTRIATSPEENSSCLWFARINLDMGLVKRAYSAEVSDWKSISAEYISPAAVKLLPTCNSHGKAFIPLSLSGGRITVHLNFIFLLSPKSSDVGKDYVAEYKGRSRPQPQDTSRYGYGGELHSQWRSNHSKQLEYLFKRL